MSREKTFHREQGLRHGGKMKILEDANEYINLQAWARKQIEELGYASTEKLKETIDRAIKKKEEPPKFNASDIKKLEDMSFMLLMALNEWRLKSFMAPGIEAIKGVKKHGQEQSQRRAKRQTWKGLNQEEILARDQRINEDFRKSRLTKNNYAKKNANKYAKEYHIKAETLRKILSKAVGI